MKDEHPNARNHLFVSLVKSVIRIGSYSALALGQYKYAAIGLTIAEVLGVLEELV
jgi:hypothetical protein